MLIKLSPKSTQWEHQIEKFEQARANQALKGALQVSDLLRYSKVRYSVACIIVTVDAS